MELTRTAIWELDGTESTAAWEALERMKRSEIVEWLMSGGNQTDMVGCGKTTSSELGWFWQDDTGLWTQFDKATSELFNCAFKAEKLRVHYSARGFTYRVCLSGDMKQTNLETGTSRAISRSQTAIK